MRNWPEDPEIDMEETYKVPLKTKISRWFLRIFFKIVFSLLGKVELSGFENIPDHNKYVVVFNHVSLVEVPFILSFWPATLEIIGAAAVWQRSDQSLLAKMWAAIQVKRTEFDREVFKKVELAFKADRPLMISPEGGRSHAPGLRRGKPGVAYIIDKISNLVVVPVGVVGNTMDFLTQGLRLNRPTIQMSVGEPFMVPPLSGKGEQRRTMRQRNTDLIMAHLAALLPESYRGVYRDYQRILAGEDVVFDPPRAG